MSTSSDNRSSAKYQLRERDLLALRRLVAAGEAGLDQDNGERGSFAGIDARTIGRLQRQEPPLAVVRTALRPFTWRVETTDEPPSVLVRRTRCVTYAAYATSAGCERLLDELAHHDERTMTA